MTSALGLLVYDMLIGCGFTLCVSVCVRWILTCVGFADEFSENAVEDAAVVVEVIYW